MVSALVPAVAYVCEPETSNFPSAVFVTVPADVALSPHLIVAEKSATAACPPAASVKLATVWVAAWAAGATKFFAAPAVRVGAGNLAFQVSHTVGPPAAL